MFAVMTVMAEAVTDAAVGAAAEAAPHASGGLPQLNTYDFAPQLIWLAIMFSLLYLILSRVALPRVGEVLTERRQRIARDLDGAAKLKLETDKALSDYEKALADARAKASGIAKEKRQALADETEAERVKTEAKLSVKLQDAENRIAANKAKALLSVNDIAAETASAVVSKLIGQDVSVADVQSALVAGAK